MAVALAGARIQGDHAVRTASTVPAISTSATPASTAGAKAATARSTCTAGSRTAATCSSIEVARRTGIDRDRRHGATGFGLGTELDIDLPGPRAGLIPTREWRIAQGHAWNIGDTIVSGIGQGYIQVTPLQLATYVARVATGRAVRAASDPQAGRSSCSPARDPADWPAMDLPEHYLHAVREGMWAVVNEPGGTAPLARLPIQRVQLAGKTGSAQVRRVSREQRENGQLRQLQAALGIPPACAVRRLCAV